METIIVGTIVIIGALSLYNFYMMVRLLRYITWILTHVKVVSKSDQKDPEFENIKRMFGIKDETDHGK